MTSALPNFRRVSDATAAEWSGEEPDPAFMKVLNTTAEYKAQSQISRYWAIAVYTMFVALLVDILPRPFSAYAHGGLLAVVVFLSGRAAFRAARARIKAEKRDREADREMKIGLLEQITAEEDKQPSRPAES